MSYYIYILASKQNGTLYIGTTNNLIKRVYEHKQDFVEGFTKRYHVHILVYYEMFYTPIDSITREKQIKQWNRLWKLKLIESQNPDWKDLYETLI